jgi:NitT/TauT family transport system ATP-binding protein
MSARGITNTSDDVIAVRSLNKTFGAAGMRVLDDISFAVPSGRFVTLVGPSGCGKSTLMQIVAGLVPASDGEILIDGEPLVGPRPASTGIVFQDALLLPWKTAAQNVEFPLALRRGDAARRRARALEMLALVGLADFADRYPHELSGGMRQRVAIARGLVEDPKILLMDEPFAALDEQTRTKMGGELLQIWERSRKTILFITHGLTEAIFLADTVLVMQARPGRIVERIDVDLPRPRTYDMIGSEYFGKLRNRIWHLLSEQVP